MQNGIHSAFIFYPSRRLGISSRFSVYIIAVGVYHHRRCILCDLMRYKTSFWWYAISTKLMIYKACALILVSFCAIMSQKRWYYVKKLFADIFRAVSNENRTTLPKHQSLLKHIVSKSVKAQAVFTLISAKQTTDKAKAIWYQSLKSHLKNVAKQNVG